MRNKIGKLFMLIGIMLIAAALSLLYYNYLESQNAMQSAKNTFSNVQEYINLQSKNETEMSERDELVIKEIDGYGYVGYLSIPVLDLRLPVMSEWDYKRLKISPCRFSGSIIKRDFVIAAHNYSSHFGNLQTLNIGDEILFTNMNGRKYKYQVGLIEELAATDISKMTAGNYELTLFTCTYGGQARVTVRCHMVNDK